MSRERALLDVLAAVSIWHHVRLLLRERLPGSPGYEAIRMRFFEASDRLAHAWAALAEERLEGKEDKN